MRIAKPEEVRPTIEKAFATPGPVVMDFIVSPEENVFPIVPAGEAIHRMINMA
jgi:acetolactate synthase-1/2/3 large subunit